MYVEQWHAPVVPTRHVDHPAVAVLHQISCLAVDPAGCDAVSVEEVWVHRRGLAVPPRWRQVRQLREKQQCRTNLAIELIVCSRTSPGPC